jgi:membrane protease YdiL (CAAX protease family)
VLLVCAVAVSVPLHAVGIHGIDATSRVLEHWPYEPARIIDSIRTALVEEVIVCGYLLHRLRQFGWSNNRGLLASMAVRCSYHVYGGILLVVFTVLFGFVMGRLYQRSRRLTAIIGAHALYDATLFTIAIAVNVHRHH